MKLKFTDNSNAVLRAFEEAMRQGLEEIGEAAVQYARQECPVDTGRLRDSIESKVDGETLCVGSDVEYAPYVEIGSSKRPGVHMIQRALTEHVEEYKQIMKEAMKNAGK